MNFAFLSESSNLAAEASLCAAEQERFWDYHDTLFANQGKFSSANLKQYARDLSLDQTLFDQCLENKTFSQAIQDEKKIGEGLGVYSTPTLIINGNLLTGARSFEEFQEIIEEELAKVE